MRKKVIQKMTSLLLAAILCAALCTDFAVRAEEGDVMTEEQSEQKEADKADDVLTGTERSEIPETEGQEQEESETDKAEALEPETDKPDTTPEDPDIREEQGQPEASDYLGEEQQAEPEELKELEQMGSTGSVLSGLNPPRILTGCRWMRSGQEVTYDCVYFGSYPQSEVLESSDPALYAELQELSYEQWSDNEATIDGNRYRRVQQRSASHSENVPTEFETAEEEEKYRHPFYIWGENYEEYHYFKYEPIKWRVLSVDGNQAFLLSDVALDCQSYSNPRTRVAINWNSKLRDWLNGLDSYEDRSFINDAFTEEQQSAIVEQQSAIEGQKEKIFLLSADEVSGSGAETKKYGFVEQPENNPNAENEYYKIDEARQCKSSNYAFAMGTKIDPYFDYPKCNNCYWWLCSPGKKGNITYPGSEEPKIGTIYETVSCVGIVSGDDGGDWGDEGYYGIRPAMWVDLSTAASLESDRLEEAGTVCSNAEREDSGDDTGNSNTGDSGTGESNTGNSGTGGPNTGNSGTGGPNTGNSGTGGPNTGNSDTGRPNTGTASKKVKVSKITLSGISKEVAAGKKIKLTAKVQPSEASNQSLTWKSSNKKVATVNSKGVVTLKKNSGGKTVTITATAKDGSKKKATYKITSMKGVVKKVTISGKGTRTVKAGKTVSLKAKVSASNSKKANKKLKWASSNTKYATVTSAGKVKTKKAGKGKKVKITAAATDGSGKKKTVTIRIR